MGLASEKRQVENMYDDKWQSDYNRNQNQEN